MLFISHDINIPNNKTIDLTTSGLQEIVLQDGGSLTFGSNAKLLLPAGAVITLEGSSPQISSSSNSAGTLIEIGGNGVYGRAAGGSNGDLSGPGYIDENSEPSGNPVQSAPLPVELVNFVGKEQRGSILLSWATVS
ncbi:hypothetical protein SAMN05421823_107169 [Catalinimonas alkaloidigena]|uniref:Uncharacterized protein n=2 Tax=Catalinimonas alkaloidigena TaxID=1075417 RepID=A0A1G9LUB0_9BACT|nr:hypothetical protein SAMN05421823_107169 [Catalinimonas alkaloidigena]